MGIIQQPPAIGDYPVGPVRSLGIINVPGALGEMPIGGVISEPGLLSCGIMTSPPVRLFGVIPIGTAGEPEALGEIPHPAFGWVEMPPARSCGVMSDPPAKSCGVIVHPAAIGDTPIAGYAGTIEVGP